MSNAEEMQDHYPGQPPPFRTADRKRCYQCHGRFGLIRRKFALKQFCSNQCVDKYKNDAEHKGSRIKAWADFLSRKP